MLDQLLAPLDYPRQAAYNAVRGTSRFLAGKGTGEDAAAMAPGGIGALLTALIGPGAGVLGAGAAQGLGMAAAPDTFGASSVADLMQYASGEAPEDQSWAGNLLMHTITDPAMLYGIGKMAQGAGSLMRGRSGPQGTPAGDLLAEQQAYTQGLRSQTKPLEPFTPGALPAPVELTPEQLAAEEALAYKWGKNDPKNMPAVNAPVMESQVGMNPEDLQSRIMAALNEDAAASAGAEAEAAQQAQWAKQHRLEPWVDIPGTSPEYNQWMSEHELRNARYARRSAEHPSNMPLEAINRQMQAAPGIYNDMVYDIPDPLKAPGSALLEKLGLGEELIRLRNARGSQLKKLNPEMAYEEAYGLTPELQEVTSNTMYDAHLVNDLDTYSPGSLAMEEAQAKKASDIMMLSSNADDAILWPSVDAPLIDQLSEMRVGSMNRGQVSELLNALRGRGIPINEEPLIAQAAEAVASSLKSKGWGQFLLDPKMVDSRQRFLGQFNLSPENTQKALGLFDQAIADVSQARQSLPYHESFLHSSRRLDQLAEELGQMIKMGF